jgi:hypothetical protein
LECFYKNWYRKAKRKKAEKNEEDKKKMLIETKESELSKGEE